MRYWLMKCEPAAYSIDDLKRDGTTTWEGVRNFQARNFLRDEFRVGDPVLFYASNAEPSGVSGLAEVARAGYPDPTQFKKGHKYFDPKAKQENPFWYLVDLRFVEKFPEVISLATLKDTPGLEDMVGGPTRIPSLRPARRETRIRHRRQAGPALSESVVGV